jgi:hypothetical protein
MDCRRSTDQREIMRVSLASKNIAPTPEVVLYGDQKKADKLNIFVTSITFQQFIKKSSKRFN